MSRFEQVFQQSLVSEMDATKQSKTDFLFKKEAQELRQEQARFQLERSEKLQRVELKHKENVRQIRRKYSERRTEVINAK